WCVTAYPDVFTCDPGPIDDTDNLWTPVHTFESEFNYFKFYFQASETPDLELTGSMGPNNWGALFDVLQFGIAQELGVIVRDVASLRANIKWLDDSRKALGFSEHHPIDAVGTDNYESQSNRRVELLFFDENDILPDLAAAESDPASSEIYLPGIYERKRFPTRPGGAKAHCLVRLLLHRPTDSQQEFTYHLTGSDGYDREVTARDSHDTEKQTDIVDFPDVLLSSNVTLKATAEGVRSVL